LTAAVKTQFYLAAQNSLPFGALFVPFPDINQKFVPGNGITTAFYF
jgi:hypothetical protein